MISQQHIRPAYLTIDEVAKLVGVSVDSVWSAIRHGRLPVTRITSNRLGLPGRRVRAIVSIKDALSYADRHIRWKARKLTRVCIKGHPRTRENTYIRPGGKQECMACRRLSWLRPRSGNVTKVG